MALTGRERLTAFRTAMRAHGLELPRELVRFGNFQADGGRRAAAHLLDCELVIRASCGEVR